MVIGIREKIEHWKILAETYLKEDKRILLKDLQNNYYFADIILVGEDTILIQCYAPEQRKGQKFRIYWANVAFFDLAREENKYG